MIPEKECPQAGQTNVYVSNPQLSITGSSDLRNGTWAEQLGHSATPALPENGNFETFSMRETNRLGPQKVQSSPCPFDTAAPAGALGAARAGAADLVGNGHRSREPFMEDPHNFQCNSRAQQSSQSRLSSHDGRIDRERGG
jgi:hypothetical protein